MKQTIIAAIIVWLLLVAMIGVAIYAYSLAAQTYTCSSSDFTSGCRG